MRCLARNFVCLIISASIVGVSCINNACAGQHTDTVPEPKEKQLAKLARDVESSPIVRLTLGSRGGTYLISHPTVFSDGVYHLGVLPPAKRDALKQSVPWKEITRLEVERDYGSTGRNMGILLSTVATYLIMRRSYSYEYRYDGGKFWSVAIGMSGSGAALGYLMGKDIKRWENVWSCEMAPITYSGDFGQ